MLSERVVRVVYHGLDADNVNMKLKLIFFIFYFNIKEEEQSIIPREKAADEKKKQQKCLNGLRLSSN